MSPPSVPLELEIFTAGRRPDANGTVIEITDRDLQDVVNSYNPSHFRAPLFVKPELSHNTGNIPDAEFSDSPWCHGIPSKLKLKGKTLIGVFDRYSPKLRDWFDQGRIPGFSASFYRPQSPSNPYPGKFALRHIAAVLHPAVKGLGMPGFSTPEYSEPTEFGKLSDFDLGGQIDCLDFGCSGESGGCQGGCGGSCGGGEGCTCGLKGRTSAMPTYLGSLMPMNPYPQPAPTLEAVIRPLRDHFIATAGLDVANQVLPEWTFRSIDQSLMEKFEAIHAKCEGLYEHLEAKNAEVSDLRLQIVSLKQELAAQSERIEALVSEVMGDEEEEEMASSAIGMASEYPVSPYPSHSYSYSESSSKPIGSGWVRGSVSSSAVNFLRGQR